MNANSFLHTVVEKYQGVMGPWQASLAKSVTNEQINILSVTLQTTNILQVTPLSFPQQLHERRKQSTATAF